MAGGDGAAVRRHPDVAALMAAQKAAETVDLAGDVREAQERIARAIRVGEMRGDPLCDVLEAISTSLGVQLQLHEAALERAQLPIDPAALVRLEKLPQPVLTGERPSWRGRIPCAPPSSAWQW